MIHHNRPAIGQEEQDAVQRILSSGMLAQGKEVEAFEDELCDFLQLPRGCAAIVSSGSAALFLALKALNHSGVSQRIALPSYVCSSLRNAVLLNGDSPEIFDITSSSPNIDINAVNNSGVQTVIVPHIYGVAADVSNVKDGINVIEDCAQAIGLKLENDYAGTLGKLGVFSFYATKLLATGEGGGELCPKIAP